MSPARLTLACATAALLLSACGMAAKPVAGTGNLAKAPGNHARVDDPRTKHVRCLRSAGLPIQLFRASGQRPGIQIGARPAGPTVIFEPTPGDATGAQIVGQAQGAEVIGAALLYPNQAPDSELQVIENCLAIGVTG
jgi:hypothetical protein